MKQFPPTSKLRNEPSVYTTVVTISEGKTISHQMDLSVKAFQQIRFATKRISPIESFCYNRSFKRLLASQTFFLLQWFSGMSIQNVSSIVVECEILLSVKTSPTIAELIFSARLALRFLQQAKTRNKTFSASRLQ